MLPKFIKKIFKRRKKPTSVSSRSLKNRPASGALTANSSTPFLSHFERTESIVEQIALEEGEEPVVGEETKNAVEETQTVKNCVEMVSKKNAEKDAAERRISASSGISLDEVSPLPNECRVSFNSTESDICRDTPNVALSYKSIPLLELITLPRGGISMDTQAVGMVQFGIPPETIKDSMRLGLAVPNVYIVPVERFCREMGPALGVNLAEFEFPAYFNFFVYKKRCTLIVDNYEAERNIRRVFSETLLGPSKFRREDNAVAFEEEDFDPDFPREAIPNFTKELRHFRIMPDGKELVLETLLNFCHFQTPKDIVHDDIGVPPPLQSDSMESDEKEEVMDKPLEMDSKEGFLEEIDVPKDVEGVDSLEQTTWTYAQMQLIPVSVVYPPDATQEQIEQRSVKRVEIFKMPGGTEYIVHDVDEHNHIVGKARFAGNVKVSESLRVDGFGGIDIVDDAKEEEGSDDEEDDAKNDDASESLEQSQPSIEKFELPPTFYPPSFGVTVLGNSHGFDKSGSVSGYVLWINGRGVMIDPPPYSSATLEREGIRPRTIVGIILTHCHADHDAGAFQKVLTGSQVVVITTPTIYKSFIRKYAALSALSPALLKHSHRHKPAIIGAPLRFQGATFHFTYTLHTIPCVGFRVEWRGRSMVFTGDHFNSPPAIDKLQAEGVLSKARADDLRNLPLQETDLLLHEAGAPPIHTPLEVLLQLPQRVKRRLYVVHTSALPPDCELRVAPTGTAGTIRLDQVQGSGHGSGNTSVSKNASHGSVYLEDDNMFSSPWSNAVNEYGVIAEEDEGVSNENYLSSPSFAHLGIKNATKSRLRSGSIFDHDIQVTPLVALRPASSTDAWFILNLLSAVPFLTSLSYASTMELLETARVDAFAKDDVILPASRRNSVLCVVWEGTCVELKKMPKSELPMPRTIQDRSSIGSLGAVWHAGDWTGPIALQPDKRLSGESDLSATHDVVAMSSAGVKAITVDYSNLHDILKRGSILYRKYLDRRRLQQKVVDDPAPAPTKEGSIATQQLLDKALRSLNVLELLDSNSALRKFSAVQKRHLECLAEGPVCYLPGERLWRAGAPVEKAFILVSGSASFVPKRRNAGSAGVPSFVLRSGVARPDGSISSDEHHSHHQESSIGDRMRLDALIAINQLGKALTQEGVGDDSSIDSEDIDRRVFVHSPPEQESNSVTTDPTDDAKLHQGLQAKHGDHFAQSEKVEDELGHHHREDTYTQYEHAFACLEGDRRANVSRRRSSRARFANKVLGRLYNRRANTAGLVFSRGHFLGDVSKMVAGLVSSEEDSQGMSVGDDSSVPRYGFGEKPDHSRSGESMKDIIYEHGDAVHLVHSSTLAAGKDGCVVLVFPKTSLIPFLDEYPGLLLSLLGTQVVV